MSLAMHESCLRCLAALRHDGVAYLCSYECTFCGDCARALAYVCPNCGGVLALRPTRRPQITVDEVSTEMDFELRIRVADTSDLPGLSVLFDGYRQFYGKASDVAAALAFLNARMAAGDSHVLLACEGRSLVGFTQLYPIYSSISMRRAWLLNDLFVAPQARGRGVAESLLAAAVAHGRNTDAAWLMLQTGQDNDIAQRLYARCGWKRDDQFLTYVYSP